MEKRHRAKEAKMKQQRYRDRAEEIRRDEEREIEKEHGGTQRVEK